MSHSPADRLDRLAAAASNAATLDPPESQNADAEAGPCCEKCGAPFRSGLVTVCRRCGWYASLGQFIEVDQNYETAQEDAPEVECPRRSHLQVWSSLLPKWSWILIATVVVIVAESVYVALFTEGEIRMYWSVIQLAIGLAAFLGCHLFNFLVSATEDADVGFLDVLIKPLSLWMRAMRNLPRRLWVADGALAGVTAVLMSVLVIGSLPYEMLFDWGGKPKKVNLLASAVKQAQKLPTSGNGGNLAEAVGGIPEGNGRGADNLEDAIGDLAGQELPTDGNGNAGGESQANDQLAGGDANADADAIKEPTKPKENKDPAVRQKIACVILGYRMDAQNRVTALVLGAMHDSKLSYAGVVTPPNDAAGLVDLADELQRSQIAHPYLPLYVPATWVQPKYVCQVSYLKRESDGRLIDVQWDKLRGPLTQPVYGRPASASSELK